MRAIRSASTHLHCCVCLTATLGSAGGAALKIAAARNPSQAREKRPA